MTIVKYLKNGEYPKEGEVVHCDNGKFSPDRAIFKDGVFYGGGEFPIPTYKMSCVSKWFSLKEYDNHKKKNGEVSYFVSFKDADNMK